MFTERSEMNKKFEKQLNTLMVKLDIIINYEFLVVGASPTEGTNLKLDPHLREW